MKTNDRADRSTASSPQPDRPDHGYGSEHRRDSPLHDWRLKAAVQTVLSRLPNSERLNYLLQRHVTRTLPVSDIELEGQVGKALRNLDAYRRHGSKPLSEAHLYEFGVGWDLLMPLVYYCLGVDRQTVVDIHPLARLDLVADLVRRLAEVGPRLGFTRLPEMLATSRSVHELASAWGIDYRAPADARAVAVPDGSIDLATSIDVLEHVPLDDIGAILLECRRIVRDGGIFRIRFDYQDHYSYFDAGISAYNYLRFTEREWRRFNPPLHYQNRLRHDGFLDLIAQAGWAILEDEHHQPAVDDIEAIRSLPLAKQYRSAPVDRLAIRFANLTLVKAPAGGHAATAG